MTSRKLTVLDLFVLVKGQAELNDEQAHELVALARQTLAGLDPEYRTKGCKSVLDGLEARKQFVMHDLAVLCYEAITHVENRIGH